MIKHSITHCYQPTNYSCCQTALSMALSFFGEHFTPEDIMKQIPVMKNDKGEDIGTINQHLASWCLSLGFDVALYTADFQIIDLAWANLPKDELIKRMTLAKEYRDIPSLGKDMSKIYMQSYIDFVNAGGNLHIVPHMTSALLDSLLPDGPLLPLLNYNVLYNTGRKKDVGPREIALDDLGGKLMNHSVVIYGKNSDGRYLIADSWEKPGLHEIEPERMLGAMAAAQVECDNLLFHLRKPQK